MTSSLIVAAGSATRMGFDKLLAPLAGEPVILRTLRAFETCPDIDDIHVVSSAERGALIADLAAKAGLTKLRSLIPGGTERHLSVWNGLQALPDDCELVAVHDGARPLIDPSQITRCIHKAADTGAAATARRVTETLKRANPDGQVLESIDREGVWVMETPQVFRLSLLRAAYAEIIDSGASVTDEVSAVERAGCAVWLVENFTPNPKITLPGDLETAERLLR
ncbi:MAG TPA: 2-C-methyl-D-erythritol 4-phosphate cytidylyltransferase [Verrucomicrobiales bacterium]|nr:2-C-methyl-D-erythritol 4-phosphate cytidylyltransferase [Verrucomicrobiales bacterium]